MAADEELIGKVLGPAAERAKTYVTARVQALGTPLPKDTVLTGVVYAVDTAAYRQAPL